MTSLTPFHIAFPVRDIAEARRFYGEMLGCPEGRSAPEWVDFDLYGHQIVAHLAPDERRDAATNPVDGEDVPVRHFGLILEPADWRDLATAPALGLHVAGDWPDLKLELWWVKRSSR